MNCLTLMLALASVANLAYAGEWWEFFDAKACDEKCYYYIEKCAYCLDANTCPPTFPAPFLKAPCDEKCLAVLSFCEEKFPECFNCQCPNLEEKEECPFEGAIIKNEDCCDEKGSMGCSEFYCPGKGEPWQCINKCEDDCLCPNVKKEETCSGEGIYIENKYCCEKKDGDGCSAWKCPGEGAPWECVNNC